VVHPPAGRSLVLTIDVITPIVDDPRAFGAIAAANSLSDVWAMGGRPEVALSFLGFPTDKLPVEVLGEVLAGMNDACARARTAIVGGHTIGDSEPKAGLAVVGSVDPGRVWSHRSAREGQALVLTKPLGTGIAGQAIRKGDAPPSLVAAATAQMMDLNDRACAVGLACGATSCTDVTGYEALIASTTQLNAPGPDLAALDGVHAMTDVTGFGLLGHLANILDASALDADLDASAVPLLDGVLALAEAGVVPGGSRRNLARALTMSEVAPGVSEALQILLGDAQTSGGLLLCLPEDRAGEAVRRLRDEGYEKAAVIGRLARATGGARMRIR
jgi:selenide,water dikinase